MPTASEGDLLHPDLDERDLEAVRGLILGLIDDARRQERQRQQLLAAATWLNAFQSFKRLRFQIGLPQGEKQILMYGAIVAHLKAAGKAMLAHMLMGSFDLAPLGMTVEDFGAMVRELQHDDKIIELKLLSADLSDVDAALGLA